MDKRDAGLFRDDWGCTCPSSDRLETFNGTTDVDRLDTEGGGMYATLVSLYHIDLLEVSICLCVMQKK